MQAIKMLTMNRRGGKLLISLLLLNCQQPERRAAMSTFVLMTKLAPGRIEDAPQRRGQGKQWLEKVHQLCPEVKFLAHYALLGRYDFMDIYEAPDEATAHKVSLISRCEGAVSAESWPALAYEDHLRVMEAVGG
jgi:uncharacterized protein with GYD domain